jgi:hypothetical protein
VRFKNTIKIISVIVFLGGLAALAIAYGRGETKTTARTTSAPAFRVVSMQSYTPAGGTRVNQNRITRLQKADGSWKETSVTLDANGGEVARIVKYAINGRGLFAVLESSLRLRYLSHRPEVIPAFNEVAVKKSPLYYGEGETFGYRTVITREGDGSDYTEYHQAVDLNGLLIKMVSASAGGTTIIEATEIQIDGFTDNEFGVMPDYPVDSGSYEKAIAVTKDANPKAAAQMERNLPK